MKSMKLVLLTVCIWTCTGMAFASPFVFIDEAQIEKVRTRLHSDEAPAAMKQSYKHVLEEAALALDAGPFSVTDKTMVPPSGDKHDYLSISPYWWPDESKTDGLPWIRRDGKTNPVSKTADTDSKRIGHFTRSVNALAIAYYFSQDQKYAQRAIEYLRVWFLDPKTRMNPNVNFAQGVPGVASGRRSGLIDSRSLVDRLLDAMAMLSKSPIWTKEIEMGIHAWYRDYLTWLLTHELPTDEATAPNNHGSWHDLQVAGISFLVGKKDVTKQMAEKGKMRLDTQFEADGTQPHELARTRSYHYSYFNLDALSMIAQLGTQVDVNLWGYSSPKGVSLKTAIKKMGDYHDPEKEWPWRHKSPRSVVRMVPIYRKAALAYDDKALMKLSKDVDFSVYNVNNLAEIWAERDVQLLWPAE
ncbi:alginate lyase family protein [Planctomycetota bacterium]